MRVVSLTRSDSLDDSGLRHHCGTAAERRLSSHGNRNPNRHSLHRIAGRNGILPDRPMVVTALPTRQRPHATVPQHTTTRAGVYRKHTATEMSPVPVATRICRILRPTATIIGRKIGRNILHPTVLPFGTRLCPAVREAAGAERGPSLGGHGESGLQFGKNRYAVSAPLASLLAKNSDGLLSPPKDRFSSRSTNRQISPD